MTAPHQAALERIEYLTRVLKSAEDLYRRVKKNTGFLDHPGQLDMAKNTMNAAQNVLAHAINESIKIS